MKWAVIRRQLIIHGNDGDDGNGNDDDDNILYRNNMKNRMG